MDHFHFSLSLFSLHFTINFCRVVPRTSLSTKMGRGVVSRFRLGTAGLGTVGLVYFSHYFFLSFTIFLLFTINFCRVVPRTSLSTINFCRIVPPTLLLTINLCRVVPRTSLSTISTLLRSQLKPVFRDIPFNLSFLHYQQKLNSPSILQKKSL